MSRPCAFNSGDIGLVRLGRASIRSRSGLDPAVVDRRCNLSHAPSGQSCSGTAGRALQRDSGQSCSGTAGRTAAGQRAELQRDSGQSCSGTAGRTAAGQRAELQRDSGQDCSGAAADSILRRSPPHVPRVTGTCRLSYDFRCV